jgi:hypothetical protein
MFIMTTMHADRSAVALELELALVAGWCRVVLARSEQDCDAFPDAPRRDDHVAQAQLELGRARLCLHAHRRAGGPPSPLAELAARHALDRFEYELVLVLAAPVLCARLAEIYTSLDGDAVSTTARVARILGVAPPAPRLFAALAADARLTRCGLILQEVTRAWPERTLVIHPRIWPALARALRPTAAAA